MNATDVVTGCDDIQGALLATFDAFVNVEGLPDGGDASELLDSDSLTHNLTRKQRTFLQAFVGLWDAAVAAGHI